MFVIKVGTFLLKVVMGNKLFYPVQDCSLWLCHWSSSFNPEFVCTINKFDLNCKTWNLNFEWTLTEDDFCIAWYDCDFYFQATTLTQNYNVRVIMSVWHPLMLQRIGKHHSCAQMELFLINSYSHVIGGKFWNYSYKIEKNHVYLVPSMFNFVWTKLHCVANFYAVWHVCNVKCLCSSGWDWGRDGSHSH